MSSAAVVIGAVRVRIVAIQALFACIFYVREEAEIAIAARKRENPSMLIIVLASGEAINDVLQTSEQHLELCKNAIPHPSSTTS